MDHTNKSFFSLTDNLFTFESCSCDCVTDIENVRPGVVKETVKIQSLADSPVRFAFAPSKGMVRLARTGAINNDRILTELLSIPDGETKKLFTFFKEFGFFFPVKSDGYEAIEVQPLYGLINRIKAVVRLISALGEPRKDYMKILGLTLYLQLTPPIVLSFECFGGQPFLTCEHALFFELARASLLPEPDLSSLPYDAETYSVPDTIFPPAFELNIEEYGNIVGGFAVTPGAAQSQMYKDVTRLYRNAPRLPHELRTAVDFLFHFQHSVAIIKGFTAAGYVEFYDTPENVKARYAESFSARIKESLIAIAKTTVSDEIGYNLGGMRPRYDVETMSPAWVIQDMLTGIYVSIFFMRPGIQLYRKCANPSCDSSFLVSTTSKKQKYCDNSCRNAAAQRAHRLRKQARG